jgi:hypothetical protein
MVKLFGIIFLVLVLISSVSAQSDISDTLGSALNNAIGTANITIENHHTEIGWPNSSGYYNLDCTFTLVNKGDANGVATVDLETDKGILLKKLTDLKVPKKASSTQNIKIAMFLLSLPSSDTIRYRIENQRTSTVDDVVEGVNKTADVLAGLANKVLQHVI